MCNGCVLVFENRIQHKKKATVVVRANIVTRSHTGSSGVLLAVKSYQGHILAGWHVP